MSDLNSSSEDTTSRRMTRLRARIEEDPPELAELLPLVSRRKRVSVDRELASTPVKFGSVSDLIKEVQNSPIRATRTRKTDVGESIRAETPTRSLRVTRRMSVDRESATGTPKLLGEDASDKESKPALRRSRRLSVEQDTNTGTPVKRLEVVLEPLSEYNEEEEKKIELEITDDSIKSDQIDSKIEENHSNFEKLNTSAKSEGSLNKSDKVNGDLSRESSDEDNLPLKKRTKSHLDKFQEQQPSQRHSLPILSTDNVDSATLTPLSPRPRRSIGGNKTLDRNFKETNESIPDSPSKSSIASPSRSVKGTPVKSPDKEESLQRSPKKTFLDKFKENIVDRFSLGSECDNSAPKHGTNLNKTVDKDNKESGSKIKSVESTDEEEFLSGDSISLEESENESVATETSPKKSILNFFSKTVNAARHSVSSSQAEKSPPKRGNLNKSLHKDFKSLVADKEVTSDESENEEDKVLEDDKEEVQEKFEETQNKSLTKTPSKSDQRKILEETIVKQIELEIAEELAQNEEQSSSDEKEPIFEELVKTPNKSLNNTKAKNTSISIKETEKEDEDHQESDNEDLPADAKPRNVEPKTGENPADNSLNKSKNTSTSKIEEKDKNSAESEKICNDDNSDSEQEEHEIDTTTKSAKPLSKSESKDKDELEVFDEESGESDSMSDASGDMLNFKMDDSEDEEDQESLDKEDAEEEDKDDSGDEEDNEASEEDEGPPKMEKGAVLLPDKKINILLSKCQNFLADRNAEKQSQKPDDEQSKLKKQKKKEQKEFKRKRAEEEKLRAEFMKVQALAKKQQQQKQGKGGKKDKGKAGKMEKIETPIIQNKESGLKTNKKSNENGSLKSNGNAKPTMNNQPGAKKAVVQNKNEPNPPKQTDQAKNNKLAPKPSKEQYSQKQNLKQLDNLFTSNVENKKTDKKRKEPEAQKAPKIDEPKKKKLKMLQELDPKTVSGKYEKNAVQPTKKPVDDYISVKKPQIIPDKVYKEISQKQKLDLKKKRRMNKQLGSKIKEPLRVLPKPLWTTSGQFVVEPASPAKVERTKATDFHIKVINDKTDFSKPTSINFKEQFLQRKNVRREDSHNLLKRRKFY